MTGRRLYDALCDAQAEKQSEWNRERYAKVLVNVPVAWMHLSTTERQAFSRAASMLTPKKKASA